MMLRFMMQFLTPFSALQTSHFRNMIISMKPTFSICTFLLGHFPVKEIICTSGSQNGPFDTQSCICARQCAIFFFFHSIKYIALKINAKSFCSKRMIFSFFCVICNISVVISHCNSLVNLCSEILIIIT